MFLVPLVLVAVVAYAIYSLAHHRHAAAVAGSSTVAVHHPSFWPASAFGWAGAGAFALALVSIALVNVVQVPFLNWGLLLAALVLTVLARFTARDHSAVVLVLLIVTALGATAAALFLAGEVLVGHN